MILRNKLIPLTFLFIIIFSFCGYAQEQVANENDAVQQKLNNVDKQFFIENKGQWPNEVLYLAQMGGLNTWITTKGMLYEFYKIEEIEKKNTSDYINNKFKNIDYKKWGHIVSYRLKESNIIVNTQGKQKQEGYYNYLIGNDLSKHISNVGLYKEVLVEDIYNGIDLRYYFDKGLLRYDYIVHPGADPSQILFSMEGSDKTYLNNKGELVFTTCFGEVKNVDLYCYQEQDKETVAAQFTKKGESWTINLSFFDKNQTLIIDPLVYSTFIGNHGDDWGHSLTTDELGDVYITGFSSMGGLDTYPTTMGAFQTTIGSWDQNAIITKLNATGNTLIYSTFLGGENAMEEGNSIAIDAMGNAFVTGTTGSQDYPTTAGAYQTSITEPNAYDVFIAKLNATGTALIYSTYIGGDENDYGTSIAIDTSGAAYITGYTESWDYPVTPGVFHSTTYPNIHHNILLTKLNPAGSALIYSTQLGEYNDDVGNSIAIDAIGNAYITGHTVGGYPTTLGAFQTTHGGGVYDVFVSKVNPTASTLIYSTYLGGLGQEFGISLVIDALGNAIVTGKTNSEDYPTTAGAYQTANAGLNDVFVSKLNATGTALIYSTYIGGNGEDYGESIISDSDGNVYVTGSTDATNFPITLGAFQTTNAGAYDVFFSKINSTGTSLKYSTYIGGSDDDFGKSINIDTLGNAYIGGYAWSSNYKVTSGAYQTYHRAYHDIFISKLCLSAFSLISNPNTNNQIICRNTPIENILYSIEGATGVVFNGLPAGVSGSWVSDTIIISGIPAMSGTFNYTLSFLGGACEGYIGATGTITIPFDTVGTDVITTCDSVTWIDGNTYTSSTNSPTLILINAAGCDSTVTLNLTINNISASYTSLENGNGNYTFTNTSTGSFNQSQWAFGDGTTSTLANPNHTFSANGTYVVVLTINDSLSGCFDYLVDSIVVTGVPSPLQCVAGFVMYPDIGINNVTVVNSSTGSNLTYLWDFGDGNTSTQQFPNHTYATSGNYYLCLTVDDGAGCVDMYCDSIGENGVVFNKQAGFTINVVGVPITTGVSSQEELISGVRVFPNPTSSELTVDTELNIDRIILQDVTGKDIKSIVPKSNTVNVEELTNGIYFIKIIGEGQTIVRKFVKE